LLVKLVDIVVIALGMVLGFLLLALLTGRPVPELFK
jgi:hypothetical protein